jgi:hypothetical protein
MTVIGVKVKQETHAALAAACQERAQKEQRPFRIADAIRESLVKAGYPMQAEFIKG